MFKMHFFTLLKKCICLLLATSILSNGSDCYASDSNIQNASVELQSITNLKEKELKNYELSGVNKKDWVQRLQWFESKIIDYYKKLNKQNILVVGNKKFLDVFKTTAEKYDWQANFTYATSAKSPEIELGGVNLVIDAQYDSKHFKKIYGTLSVSSFKDVYAEILYDETLTFLEKNGVKYYFFEGPKASQIKNWDSLEISAMEKRFKPLSKNIDFVNQLYKDNMECRDFILSGRFNSLYKNISNGKHYIAKDFSSKFYNVNNGQRITAEKPVNFKSSIHVFGPCTVRGAFVTDGYTITSYLQRSLNKVGSNYSVENYGTSGRDTINDFEYMLNTNLIKGDIIVEFNDSDNLLRKIICKHNNYYFKTSSLFNRPHNYGYWLIDCPMHMNHIGNKVIADYIYNMIKLELNNCETFESKKTVKYQFENEADTFLDDNPDFKNYLEELKNIKKKNNVNGKVGSIVMNCNPFTLGHRYLIKEAAKQVEHLYIFVVEEDKSVFPFKDRMELVKKGVADLGDKVTVLPSGKWIISLLTFPEYFNKDDLQGTAIDPSNDIKLFGKYICPALGINKRFVGEEPFDLVTRQYNDTMRRELPLLNIDFQEIPRKSVKGEDVISATKVRKALKAKDFETLKNYVPKTTFDYLKENYEPIVKAIDSKYNY